MKTEELKQIFTEYLDSNQSNALLINGKWGSGKTFFWKSELEEIIKNKKLSIIYVSLNGINKIENLERILFLKLIPYMNKQENKILKSTINLITNFINKASQKYLDMSLSDILNGVSIDSFNFDNYVICFDDLERCQIPTPEILGYINNLIEHKNLKTIILADEIELRKKDKEAYDVIKEKLIFRIINFDIPIEETFPKLLIQYQSENDFHTFLSEYKIYIEEILEEYKEKNLRTISFYLNILQKLFPLFKEENEKIKKEIILFSSIISIEFKKGILTSSDHENSSDYEEIYDFYYSHELYDSLNINNDENEKVEGKSKKQIIYETYLRKRVQHYNCYLSIYSYILSGFLNENLVLAEINNRNKINYNSPELRTYSKIINQEFRILNNDEFEKEINDLIKFSKKGVYTIYEYNYISYFLNYYAENDLINLNNEEIFSIVEIGIKKSAEKSIINDKTFENILRYPDLNEKDKIVKQLIKNAHDKIDYHEKSLKFINFLLQISNDKVEYMEEEDKYNFLSELFKYVKLETLTEIIKNMKNKNLRQFTSLLLQSKLYYFDINSFPSQENKDFITSLKESVNNHINNGNVEKLNKFLLIELNNIILNIEIEIEKRINNSI